MFQYRNGHNNSSYFKHHLCLHRQILFFLIKCSTFCFLSLNTLEIQTTYLGLCLQLQKSGVVDLCDKLKCFTILMDTLLILHPVCQVYILSFAWFAQQSQYYVMYSGKKNYGIFPFITSFGNFGDSP